MEKCNNDATTSRWSALPSDLVGAITRRLETRYDLRHFRQVCHNWRHFTPLSLLHHTAALHPLLPVTIPGDSRVYSGRPLKLVAAAVCLLRPIEGPTDQPWLATVEEFNRGKLFLRLPLSRTPFIRNLPPNVDGESYHRFNLLPSNFPVVFDLSNFHVHRLFGAYCLRFVDETDKMFLEKTLSDYQILKVVLLINPDSRNYLWSNRENLDDCQLMVLDQSGYLGTLDLKSRGEEDGEGEMSCGHIPASPMCSCNDTSHKYDDIVRFGDYVYAVDRKGLTHYYNYGSTERVLAANPIPENDSDKYRKWLVKFDGGLYLVNKFVNPNRQGRMEFEVYELDFDGQCWNRVKSLGDDRILFVTYDGAFSANVEDFPGWKGNCIVYYSGSFSKSGYFSVFHGRAPDTLCKELVLAVYYFDDSEDAPPGNRFSKLRHIALYENYCKMFWPPPAWVV